MQKVEMIVIPRACPFCGEFLIWDPVEGLWKCPNGDWMEPQ